LFTGDAAATVHNIAAHQLLYRLGFAVEIPPSPSSLQLVQSGEPEFRFDDGYSRPCGKYS
jgi:hypothetical protein